MPKKKCPHKRTIMTPCVIEDGDCAYADDDHCVGCSRTPEQTGVPNPPPPSPQPVSLKERMERLDAKLAGIDPNDARQIAEFKVFLSWRAKVRDLTARNQRIIQKIKTLGIDGLKKEDIAEILEIAKGNK